MNTITNIWKSRCLSLKGKITIIKTLIIPQIHFLFAMIYIPVNILQKIDKILFDFLWSSKPAKIKRSTIIATIEEGGLGMVDVYNVHMASKISWIKRLNDTSKAKWKTVMLKLMNTDLDILNKKYEYELNRKKIPQFYDQVLKAWYEVSNFLPTTPNEILNEYVLYNTNIKIRNKPIDKNCLNIPNLKIIDIIENNNFKTLIQFNRSLKTNINQMKYNSVLSAVPLNWKKTGGCFFVKLERETRFELATPTLARLCSTTELFPHRI